MGINSSSVNLSDIINLSKDIAQLNLGYLGVSVTILLILGGIFVYFNFGPIKETLKKQEKDINNLKERADGLLDKSKTQANMMLENFEKNQLIILNKNLEEIFNKIELSLKAKISNSEGLISEKINKISDEKDEKNKQFIISKISNQIKSIEKSIDLKLNKIQNLLKEEEKDRESAINGLKFTIKDMQRDIKELKIWKFAQEGKMGSIIYSISLLKDDIDDETDWRIIGDLEALDKNIEGCSLDSSYVSQIEEQISRIESTPKYKIIIEKIRKKYSGGK